MAFWKPPTLPKPERMPMRRTRAGPSSARRVVAGLAGVTLTLAGIAATWRSLLLGASRFGSFRALFLLVPAIFLWRYAATGRFR